MEKRSRVPSHDYDDGTRFWENAMVELGNKVQKEMEHGPVTRADVLYAMDHSSVWRDVATNILYEVKLLQGLTGDVTTEEVLGISLAMINFRVLNTFLDTKRGDYMKTMKYFVGHQKHILDQLKERAPEVIQIEDEPRVSTKKKKPSTPILPGSRGEKPPVFNLDSPRSDATEILTAFDQPWSKRLVPYESCLKCGKYKAVV